MKNVIDTNLILQVIKDVIYAYCETLEKLFDRIKIICLKIAPITFCDVVAKFFAYKYVFTDKRHSLSWETIKKYLVTLLNVIIPSVFK